MKSPRTGMIFLTTALVSTLFFSGCGSNFNPCGICTNWKAKYKDAANENQKLLDVLHSEQAQRDQLTQTIEELQKKMNESKQPANVVTGFGPDYNVSLNQAANTMTVTLPDSILFDSGKAELKQSAKAKISHIVSVLKEKYADKKLDAVGHTDNEPIQKSKWKDNQELSEARAAAVKQCLVNDGINADMIQSIGKGDTAPVASNDTATGRYQNRRVEIVVHM